MALVVYVLTALLLTPPATGGAVPPGSALETNVFVSGADGYHTYRIPALVVTNNGTVLAFCEGRKSGSGDAGDIDLLVRRSLDDGKTWEGPQIVHEEGGTAGITIGNPCPIVDRKTGTVHLLFCRNNRRAFVTRSTNDGGTWTKPSEISPAARGLPFDWKRLGTGPGHGIQLREGRHEGRLVAPIWLNTAIGQTGGGHGGRVG
jgi:sialidase-1